MVHIKSPDPVAWLVSSAVSAFGLLCLAAFIYEKTRRRIDHPKFGKMAYHAGAWSGTIRQVNPESELVRFEIPGDKTGPDPSECEQFSEFWTSIQETLTRIRPEAIGEFQEIRDCYESEPEAVLVQKIQTGLDEGEQTFDEHWKLSYITKTRETRRSIAWILEFDVAWDIEHTRSAYLDENGQVLTYTLSCAGPDLDDEEGGFSA